MKILDRVPKYEELDEYYGSAELEKGVVNLNFMTAHCERLIVPFPLILSWDKKVEINRIVINSAIVEVVKDAFQAMADYKGVDYLIKNRYNIYGGSYSYRPQRGGSKLTTHAWAIAIDLNPQLAPYRVKEKTTGEWMNEQPDFIRDAFLDRNFVTFPWDGMHFQACEG